MRKILAFISCLIIGQSSMAQERLTLSDAINMALQKSLDIQLAKNNLSISEISDDVGFAGGLPTVNATVNDNEQVVSINQEFSDPSRNAKRPGVGSNNLFAGITASMVLYNGSRIVSTRKRLEQLKGLNQQLLLVQIQNTIAAVTTGYYDVVRQQELLKTIHQSIIASRKRLEILLVRKDTSRD